MRRFFIFSFLLLAGCAKKVPILKEYGEGVWLGFKFTPGRSMSYKQTMNISTTVETKGFAQSINTMIEIRTTQTVEDTGETVDLKVSFEDVTGTMRMGGQLRPIEELDELKGKVVSLKLSRDGKVVELKGLEEVEYFKKAGEKPETQFEESFGFLPNKMVKTGESWTKEFDGKKATYTLRGFEKKDGVDCAKISVEYEVETTRVGTEKGIQSKMEIKGRGKGEIFFALEDGIIIESSSSLSLEGEQKISGATLPEPMSMPIYIDQDSHTELIR